MAKRRRIQLDTSTEGAAQLLRGMQQYGSVCWDGSAWMPFTGDPAPPTLAVLRYTAPNGAADDDPIANLLMVHWQTKGDGSVVTVPGVPAGGSDAQRLAAHLVQVQAWLDSARKRTKGERTPIPDSIIQPTFIEARFAGQALADGPTQRHWEEAAGEVALLHIVPDAPIQTKVRPSMSLEWLDKPATVESIRADLQSAGVPAIIAMHTALDMTIKNERVTLTLDDMMTAIGWKPRSTAERAEKRRQLWRWLLLFDSMLVIGRRPGTYRDPLTKQTLDLQSYDPLIRIVGRRNPLQAGLFDDSQPPIEVSIVAGQWVDKFRDNPHVLTYFGDVRRIGEIPAGKPSGAWAQAVGLALHQRWREGSSRASVSTVGEDNHLTIKNARPFTRRDLLGLFPPQPTVDEILESDHPSRAREYWRDAIKMLQGQGVVGHYAEVQPLPTKRQNWQAAWLDQPLDIRPSPEGATPLADMARRAQNAKRQRRNQAG